MIDQEMLEEFIIEAEEHLTEMEQCLLRLEEEPGNRELLNDIFRAAHSLKGTAGLTGLIKINEVAHKMEGLLEYLRQGKLNVSTAIVSVLFQGMDIINSLVKGLSENGEEAYDINSIVEKLEKILTGEEDISDHVDSSGSEGELIEETVQDQELKEEDVDLLAEEKAGEPSDEHNSKGVPEEISERKPFPVQCESEDEFREPEHTDDELIDDLEQLFIDQAKEKIQTLASLMSELKEEASVDVIHSGRNEIEDFQNIVEMSNHDELLNPLRHMDEILQNACESGQGTESSHIEELEADLGSIAEKLKFVPLQPMSSISNEQECADQEERVTDKENITRTVQSDILSIVDELRTIKGLGPSKIQAICDAGLTDKKDFRNITKKELMQVKGITKKLAQKIVDKLQSLPFGDLAEPDALPSDILLDEGMSDNEPSAQSKDISDNKPFTQVKDISLPKNSAQIQDNEPLCISLEDAIINDEYDSELIEIFLNHIRKGYEELSSDFYGESDKGDSEKIENALEIVMGLRKASNYMDFPEITNFFSQWIDEIKECKRKITEGETYTLNFMNSNIERIKVFLPNHKADEIITRQERENIISATGEVQTSAQKTELSSEFNEIIEPQEKTHPLQETEEEQELLNDSLNSNPLKEDTISEETMSEEVLGGEITLGSGAGASEQEIVSNEEAAISDEKEEKSATTHAEVSQVNQAVDEPGIYEEEIIKDNSGENVQVESINNEQKASATQERSQAAEVKQTLRVDTQKVDALMNQVGELVVNRALFSQLNEELKIRIKELLELKGLDKKEFKDVIHLNFRLGEATVSLGRVANELQESVMKIRMLPISKLFNRYPRLVRELAIELAKKVELRIQGENTELDKRVIEQMADPLIHIIRNAIDHGIEMPQERKKKGKQETGILIMSSYYEGNHVVIRIDDDGRGIDRERIKAKALSMGLITKVEAERYTEKEILNLIFLPGMSTASEVTRTSGRGVGMDVVKKNVEKLNGTIEVSADKDIGTTFIIKIPLTLAIIQVLLVKVCGQTYCIPLTSVIETVRIFKRDINTIEGREVINIRDTTIPLIRLSDVFNYNGQEQASGKTFVVITTTGHKEVGLVVDGLMGEQEVVIKPLGDYLCSHKGFSGATIMGDGSISLILDISELVNIIIENVKHQNQSRELQTNITHCGVEHTLN
jgi:two-component system chemotaxis sensor kinase CheA